MITPVLQDEAFLEDISQAKKNPDQLHLWWLGQSGFLIQYQGRHLLMDPYLSDSLTKKYADTNKPHVRMTERVIAPERLQGSPDQSTPIQADGEAIEVEPFAFHAIPSAHESLEQDADGDHHYTGFMVRAGKWTIYHSGDCVPYEGLVERLKIWKIDIALLPINGRDPRRGVAGNFTAEEAARLGKEIHAGMVISCHYEIFEFNTVSPEGFVHAAEHVGQSYRLLRCGERRDL